MRSKKLNETITKSVVYVLLAILTISMLLPFLWMVSTSLMEEYEVFQFPPKLIPDSPKWSNYKEALSFLPFDRFF